MNEIPGRPSREETAAIEVGRTDVAPLVARMLIAGFLTTIVAIPVLQSLHAYDRYRSGRQQSPWPPVADLYRQFPEIADTFEQTEGGLFSKVLAANADLIERIDEVEKRVDRESLPTRALGGRAQSWLLMWGGVGNEQVYPGKDGWLFFRPDVDHVTGRGFLWPAHLESRAVRGNERTQPPQPDPLAAIRRFHLDLRQRGIKLVVVPTPVKPMIHPEKLSARYVNSEQTVRNASFGAFRETLEREGVIVFDVADELVDARRRSGEPQYLETDTHWTPQAMQLAAVRLAEFLRAHVDLPPRSPAGFQAQKTVVGNRGDIARLLRLPHHHPLNRMQNVTLRTVFRKTGDRWEPDDAADVLLLGDSFTNIYSQAELKWGRSAGLAEQLAFELQRPVDRIARNDDGAFATRKLLSEDTDRLTGVRVVVWQFADRELSSGDWKIIPLPHPANGANSGPALDD